MRYNTISTEAVATILYLDHLHRNHSAVAVAGQILQISLGLLREGDGLFKELGDLFV